MQMWGQFKMKILILCLSLFSAFNLTANTQKLMEGLNSKKVIENEKFIVLSEDFQGKNSYYLVYGEYNYAGSSEAEYIVANFNSSTGLDILIRDQALHGMVDGIRKAADIPINTRQKLLLAYGNHRTPTENEYKTFKTYIAAKIKKNNANSDEKWLYTKLKAPAKR